NQVPKKYDGLDGTELAISESQERMAVALEAQDVEKFLELAREENLEATVVAKVTEEKRLRMVWNDATIVDISREFLNSNGAPKHVNVKVVEGGEYTVNWPGTTLEEKMTALLGDLNVCSKKGLSERFDSTIGAATVLMPFGGKHQLTPSMAMAAKLPVDGETTTCSGMAWGYNPFLMEKNQFRGAYISVVESVSRLVAAGFRHEDAYLTFQEYFERLGQNPERWGKPVAALLGALKAQVELGIGSIGGKDSMSGSFEDLDVPPTLVSFATAVGHVDRVRSPEFKKPGSQVVILRPRYNADGITPEAASLKAVYSQVERLIDDGRVLSIATPGYGGLAEALFKMCVGNGIGLRLVPGFEADLFAPAYGTFVLELSDGASTGELLGETTVAYVFETQNEKLDLAKLQEVWESKLEPVMPYRAAGKTVETVNYPQGKKRTAAVALAKPRVIIPVFPGTNCEFDSAHAFERVGAEAKVLVINNLTPAAVAESCQALCDEIKKSQIVMIPGGFSGGDEPDGSAKFITAFFRAPAVTEAVRDLLQHRDGLMLGICNGFQALVKLGLVPYGDIIDTDANCPTLTF
ncbi:MAG: phosphoribosylformylglycinamidine synthase subunit PurQ, partial [Oscillospiraceae bacterium]|nr:phosphoribosylformylglycinamidine synthase subunit PurQ [Oscillospiraceae bacterium]